MFFDGLSCTFSVILLRVWWVPSRQPNYSGANSLPEDHCLEGGEWDAICTFLVNHNVMYAGIWICCACVYIYIYNMCIICMYIYIKYVYIYIYNYIHKYVYMYIYIYMYICMYSICKYIYMYVCTVHIYIYIEIPRPRICLDPTTAKTAPLSRLSQECLRRLPHLKNRKATRPQSGGNGCCF